MIGNVTNKGDLSLPKPRLNPDRVLSPAEKQRAYRQRQAQVRLQELEQKGLPPAPAVPSIPGTRRWSALVEQGRSAFAIALEEMQSYFDDRSDQWQESERGEQFQERIEALQTLIEEVEQFQSP